MENGSVRSSAQKRRHEESEEETTRPSKKRDTHEPFDANHPFWSMHNVDPINVHRSPRTPFPDPISTHAHPLRESTPSDEGPSTPRQVPTKKRKAHSNLEGHPGKVSKPNPTKKRKASAISKSIVRPTANHSPAPKKLKVSEPTTVRERVAAFDRAVHSFPRT